MRDAQTYIAGKATLDFANTGHPAAVYLLRADSGAGAGCDLAYYDTKPDDRSSAGHQQLMAMQAVDLTDVYPRRTCHDADPQWFTFAGVAYLETRSARADMPGAEQDEYDTVDVIRHGTPARVCRAMYEHDHPLLSTVWSGTAWVPPPADMPRAPPDPIDPPY